MTMKNLFYKLLSNIIQCIAMGNVKNTKRRVTLEKEGVMSKDRNDAIDVKFTLDGMVYGAPVVDIY